MTYDDYKIEHDRDHYVVTAPDGTHWTEDTYEDAVQAIEEEIKAPQK